MSNLWFVFIPDNCNKTLLEMTDYERNNRLDNRTSATDQFIEWYKLNFIEPQKNKKKINRKINYIFITIYKKEIM